MFKLSQFRSEIESAGVMRTNTFVVSFAPPRAMRLNSRLSTDRLSLRCETVQMPGMNFATIDGPPMMGYGPIESIPYGSAFEDITCTFIVDARGDVHRFFYTWMSSIVNFRAQGQSRLKDENGPVAGMKPYEVNFKDDIVTDITIDVYDTSVASLNNHGQKVMTTKIYRAFPKSLPSYDMSWSSNDEVVRLNIPFNYTDFDIKYHNKPTK